ncbi:MAG: YwqJ-related putative deaminase [Cellulosilyticaceae bacterium]
MSKKKIQNKLGPAVAGVYDPVADKYYFGINNLDGDLPENLHRLLRVNYENMPTEDTYTEYNKFTLGAGSHAEIYALNEALIERGWMGIPVESLDELILTVIKGPKCGWKKIGIPMPRCPHCEFITDGVNYFPEVLKYEKQISR